MSNITLSKACLTEWWLNILTVNHSCVLCHLVKKFTQLFQISGEAKAFIAEKLGRITTTHILFCATLTGQTHHANGILSKLAYFKLCAVTYYHWLIHYVALNITLQLCHVVMCNLDKTTCKCHVHLTMFVITAHKWV